MNRPTPSRSWAQGCRVCDVIRPGMLTLESGAMVCRACANRISAFLRRATPAFLEGVWVGAGHTAPSPMTDTQLASELAEAATNRISPKDFNAHWDLSRAYEEMGLFAYAIAEMAVVLDERATHDMAQEAFTIIFDSVHVRSGALDRVADALRAQ